MCLKTTCGKPRNLRDGHIRSSLNLTLRLLEKRKSLVVLLKNHHFEEGMRRSRMIVSEEFLTEVRSIAASDGVSHMEAVIEVCTKRGIEIEVAASIIKMNPTIKALVQKDAEDLNYLPKTKRLPRRKS